MFKIVWQFLQNKYFIVYSKKNLTNSFNNREYVYELY